MEGLGVNYLKVATCNLNQWAMDFDHNLSTIIESLRVAKAANAAVRVGPELEFTGYSCEDHFNEPDTESHGWQSLAQALPETKGIVADFGMVVTHRGTRYNCRLWAYDGKILGVRPKTALVNDGNYREPRWFTAWRWPRTSSSSSTSNTLPTSASSVDAQGLKWAGTSCALDSTVGLEWLALPECITQVTGQTLVPFGVFAVRFRDVVLASEVCEELFTPNAMNIPLYLNGVDVICNGSGSHHSLRKLNHRIELMQNASRRSAGGYIYANQQGCDGARLYFDGCASVFVGGNMVAQGSQFGVGDVEVVTAIIDVTALRGARHVIASRGVQANDIPLIPNIEVDALLCRHDPLRRNNETQSGYSLSDVWRPSLPMVPRIHPVEEEIAMGPACWLWDYLRRSGLSGFFLPLSGGADSTSTAAIVASMCAIVAHAYNAGQREVVRDVRRILNLSTPNQTSSIPSVPSSPIASSSSSPTTDSSERITARDLCHRIFFTCYMGTKNSSMETRQRAAAVAKEIGSTHLEGDIDNVVQASVNWFVSIAGESHRPTFTGSLTQNLALQNVQARIRMVQSYLAAQLILETQGRKGSLLVLGSANVDEGLRGFLTKYDCSSADINPIGSISKLDLRRFLCWAAVRMNCPTLAEVAAAKPSPELVPVDASGKAQVSEEDMGLTFEELGLAGRLRKIGNCGPVSMFYAMLAHWGVAFPSAPRTGSVTSTSSASTTLCRSCGTACQGLCGRHLRPIDDVDAIFSSIGTKPLESETKVSTSAMDALSPATAAAGIAASTPSVCRTPAQVAEVVKKFFRYYAINRHKTTTLTPAYHAESYSPDDNRFDLRQFLYNAAWPRQFKEIDRLVAKYSG